MAVAALGPKFDFSKSEGQAAVVHGVRLAFLLLVLFITLSFQMLESRIDASQVFGPVFVLIGLSLSLQIIYISFFKVTQKHSWITGFLFFFEAFYITGLIYFIGVQQSILIFLYLVNLILCGILFQRKGALLLALWTSVLFSFIVSMDTGLTGNTAYLAVGVNNIAFFTVAYLSGFLSEQLNIVGEQLKEKVKDVAVLQNLNAMILKSMNSGLVTIDREGLILQGNPKAYKLLGAGPNELIGSFLEKKLPGLNYQQHADGRAFDYDFYDDEEKKVFEFSVSALSDDDNQPQGWVVHFQDETQIRALEKRVRQSEKMAAIGQLAAGIAHEIRNPLAGISGSIQLLQAADASPEQNDKLMGIVEKEIARLNNLITEFLDYAKPEAPMEDHIVLEQIVRELGDFLKNDTRYQNLELDYQFSDQGVILGNRDKLRQAFMNIMVNGVQAAETKGDPRLRISLEEQGEFVQLKIADNGSGIPSEQLSRIFEPFHTTKHKGTGLGLAITHSIFESHAASVNVNSEVGKGTEFVMRFRKLAQV